MHTVRLPGSQFEAQRLNQTYYYNGTCRRGHYAARYTSNGNCVRCVKEYNERYTAQYRKKETN